jgi:MoxR-like ATPase
MPMPMTVENLKNAVQDAARTGDFATIDTPTMTALIEGLSFNEVESLHKDRNFVELLMAPIHTLHKELKEVFIERDELIQIALASFLVQVPMIALGPPGTAKSAVFRGLADRLGLRGQKTSISQLRDEMFALNKAVIREGAGVAAQQRRYFEYLVTRFTTADEILGPPHLDTMISYALFYRQTAGLLPEAHVAFLDEVFKANAAILNALLSIMNERLFYNAGRATKIPLCMVFDASNEPPPDQELSAFYDRFPIRVMCNSVTDEKLHLLLKEANRLQVADVIPPADQVKDEKPQLASVNHFRMMFRLLLVRAATWRGTAEQDFRNSFVETFRVFRREFRISDRSLSRFYLLAQALALFMKKNANEYPGTSELVVFKYCFQDMESAAALADAVNDRVNRR